MRALVIALVLLLAGPAGVGVAGAQVVDLPTRPGVTVRILVVPPAGRPSVAAILFTGGPGVANIPERPGPGWGANFLVRARALFSARGVYTVVMDAPSDHRGGLGTFRITADHAADIAAVVAEVRRRAGGVPVWLVGNSLGSISAANGAARLPSGTVAGAVLTSSTTRAGRSTSDSAGISVLNADLASIRVPVLVLHHRDDSCVASPFSGAETLRARLAASPRAEVIGLSGGDAPRSGPCDPFAPHGYLGIEDQAVQAMVAWMTQR